jgi:superfamily I DNA/RNA helicase
MEDGPTPELAAALVDAAMAGLDERTVRRSVHSYRRDADFARVRSGFSLLLQQSADQAETWPVALDRFEGRAQVPLMTVHKSKGMEFHTMIFFGLDGDSWWSLTPNRPEELNSFFVAFRRCEDR